MERPRYQTKISCISQGSGRMRSSSDYIEILPAYLLNIPTKFDTHIDIMIEAKQKKLSIQKLYDKIPHSAIA